MVLQFAIPLRSHASADERLELAAKTLSSYIQDKRTDPDLYMVRGLLYEKIGRFEQSLADLQTAKALYLTAKATVRVTIAMCAIDELKLRMRKQNAQ
jgi:Flp pilus assembly protein TadD